ncbi:hypothetical protein TRIP_C60520 [Candidatus Zixiibacteriota bacterium]|nr:hypothetical protein TRIP_C60520 [candidate division Zixibacteria bacterium]
MNQFRVKVISDMATDRDVIGLKPPFSVHQDKQRRYVRLQVAEPVAYTVLRNRDGGFWPDGDGRSFNGSVLNISAGGVLIAAGEPIEEGSVILLRFSLQDIEIIDHVVGLVKRADADGDEWLIGVEFISKEYLRDIFSGAEMDVLPPTLTSFDEGIKKMLNKYVYRKRVSRENR